jgi:hypothetical protein
MPGTIQICLYTYSRLGFLSGRLEYDLTNPIKHHDHDKSQRTHQEFSHQDDQTGIQGVCKKGKYPMPGDGAVTGYR